MQKYKIIFMGTPIFAKEILEKLNLMKEMEIILVVSQPDKQIGRKKTISKPPVKIAANNLKLNLIQPENIRTEFEYIKKLNPDFIITCAYGQFIPKVILSIPKECINIHASYLPRLRGGAPMQWSIMNGDKETGISIMRMVQKMDAGPIFVQEKITIDKYDTLYKLENKLISLSKNMLDKYLVNIFENKYLPKEQDKSKITFGFNISREDEKINFDDHLINIYNKIRGLYPKPLAYALINNIICKIHSADYEIAKVDKKIKNGLIVKINKNGIYIKNNDGFLILKEIQFAGKKAQHISTFYKNNHKYIYVGNLYE